MNGDAFVVACDLFGLDEFQRIAASDLLRELDDLETDRLGLPAPGSLAEQKLIELGALISTRHRDHETDQ